MNKNYFKFAFVFLFLFSFYFVNAIEECGNNVDCKTFCINNGYDSFDLVNNFKYIDGTCSGAIPGTGTACPSPVNVNIRSCTLVENSVLQKDEICSCYNWDYDASCAYQGSGQCNTKGTGICIIPEGLRLLNGVTPLVSVNCLNGCEGNVCDGREIYDSGARLIKVDYIDDSQDISYSYFGNSFNVQRIDIGNGKEKYSYDEKGNLLSEEYRDKPELNTLRSYYFNDNLKKIVKMNSYTHFFYDSKNRVESEIIMSESVKTIIKYEYDSEDRVIRTISPLKVVNYEYDSDGNLVREYSAFYDGTFTDVSYSYDEKGNMISMWDNLGNKIDYNYESVGYPCTNFVCNNEDCSDFSNVESTCSYDRLKSKTIGAYTTEVNYSDEEDFLAYNSYFSGDPYAPYAPLEKYNSETGLLEEDDYLVYAYGGEYELERVTARGDQESFVSLDYYSDGGLATIDYGDNLVEGYYYEPLGRETAYKYCYSGSCSFQFPLIGAILPFIFKITGNAIGDSGYIMMYSLEPGDSEGFVTKSEFDSAIEKYELENGEIVEYDYEPCDSSFEFSEYSYCSDENSLSEYYCGRKSLFNSELIVKPSASNCEFGCEFGACLKESTINQTVNETAPDCFDSDGGFDYYIYGNTTHIPTGQLIEEDYCDNNVTLVEQACFVGQGYGKSYIYYDCPNGCVNGVCVETEVPVLDLPPEPENPERV